MEEKENFEPKACPFFRSYYDSVQELEDKDRLDFYELVIEYFFKIENEDSAKSPVSQALFKLTKPVVDNSLDIAKKRAEAGAKGGKAKKKQKETSHKQTTKSRQAPHNQTQAEMEMEMEMDIGNGLGEGEENGKEMALDLEKEATASAAGGSHPQRENVPYSQIQEAYNSICTRLPAIKSIDGERRKKTSAFFKKFGLETASEIFTLANDSDFLCGGGNGSFMAKFDWIIKLDNANKILEGNYANNKPTLYQHTAPRGYQQPEARGFVGHAMGLIQEQESTQWTPPPDES